MPYRDRLNYWAIVCLLPNMQRSLIARYHRRPDADGHLRILQQTMPDQEFIVVFDLNQG
jgi:hypothetical protein